MGKVFVRVRQKVKRGDLIGLSGDDTYRAHLHFGVVKYFGVGLYFQDTYNPNTKGLGGGPPECFNPNGDYNNYPVDAVTLPFPCESDMDYYKDLAKKNWL